MKLLIVCVILIATHTGAQLADKKICFTQWFDRDNPSGNGDYETLSNLRSEYPRKICTNPLSIQAATLTGVTAESIGQVFQAYDTVTGFACVNSNQRNEECCLDYKVRFGCPCPWPPIKPILAALVEDLVMANETLS